MKWFSVIAFIGILTSLTPAFAQASCFNHEKLKDYLVNEYAEESVSAGIVENGFLLEVFNNVKNDLWVLIMTSPDKTSCIMATGRNWRSREPVSAEKKS
ncbi:MAG: hypothetical protein V7750_18305 [Sneathiella sp.]